MTIGERIARWSYGMLWVVATPVVAGYLLWRGRRQPDYRRDWGERFLGRYRPSRAGRRCLWIHAVSVGETRAAAPLVEALLAAYPDLDLLVTHMTPTGRETAVASFGDRVLHAYLAYDYPHAVAAFLRHWRPVVGIVMETEIWPNLMAATSRGRVPMVLANARLSAKSLAAAERWSALMRPAAARFACVLAQTDADAERFARLIGRVGTSDRASNDRRADTGPSIAVVGNLKFDAAIPERQRALGAVFRDWVAALAPAPRVFLCASTRDGEEARIVDAWLRHARGRVGIDEAPPLLVIVPRHPQRFDEVAAMVRAKGLPTAVRSTGGGLPSDTRVWIGDSMGELPAYYLAADVAYVGGSIAALGGQNLIEAAAAGVPVLIGRHTFNFAMASDAAVAAGAALRVDDYDALVATAVDLAADADRRRRMRDAGIAFAAAHGGATARTVDAIGRLVANEARAASSP